VLMFGTTLVFGYLVRRRVAEPDDRLPAAG
jgi:hypothetical protein